MNFIDIASYQQGISLPAVFAQNDLDGVIVKATEGTTYVNPFYAQWAEWLSKNKKLFGVYHFLAGADAAAEAKHFYNNVKPYIGQCVPVADYEEQALSKGTAWLKRFLDKFYELSGVKCMIYCSLSVIHEQDFSALTSYPLWIAQYADMAVVYGFLDDPWQSGSVSPFAQYWMHQYSGNGRILGYGGVVDLDKFYGTVEDWEDLARGNAAPTPTPMPDPTPTPAPTPKLKPADPSIVLAVLKNEYGIGQSRINKLRSDGYDPDSVQAAINRLYGVAGKVKKDIGNDMSYINAILWIVRSL